MGIFVNEHGTFFGQKMFTSVASSPPSSLNAQTRDIFSLRDLGTSNFRALFSLLLYRISSF